MALHSRQGSFHSAPWNCTRHRHIVSRTLEDMFQSSHRCYIHRRRSIGSIRTSHFHGRRTVKHIRMYFRPMMRHSVPQYSPTAR